MDISKQLIEAAERARINAYAPYSGYTVGAALVDDQGRIWSGCNVENVSYGLSICGERSAVSRMVSEGGKALTAVAVVTADGGMPCGMCLQTLVEFTEEPEKVSVWTASQSGTVTEHKLAELLPFGFANAQLKRT